MQWIDRDLGYPKLTTKIIGNFAMMSIKLEISKDRSFSFGSGRDMNMTDAIDYILSNFSTLEKELIDELKECRTKLND